MDQAPDYYPDGSSHQDPDHNLVWSLHHQDHASIASPPDAGDRVEIGCKRGRPTNQQATGEKGHF